METFVYVLQIWDGDYWRVVGVWDTEEGAKRYGMVLHSDPSATIIIPCKLCSSE